MDLDAVVLSPPPELAGKLALEAESMGLSGAWFPEAEHNPYIGAALAAANTSSIQLGTAIALAFPRSPMVTAQIAWDLSRLSGGRFILGLGPQVKAQIERRFSTPFSRPVPRLREYCLALRAIFDAFQGRAPLDFHGEFYDFTLLTDEFSGGPIANPDVPIMLSGLSDNLARAAAQVGDGFIAHAVHSRAYLKEVIRPAIDHEFESGNAIATNFTVAVPVFCVPTGYDADRENKRIETIRRRLAFYLALYGDGKSKNYNRLLELHDLPGLAQKLSALQADGAGVDEMTALISDDVLDIFAVVRPWEELADELIYRYAGVVDRVILYGAPLPSWSKDPILRDRLATIAGRLKEA